MIDFRSFSEDEDLFSKRILQTLNTNSDLKEKLRIIINQIYALTNIESLAIRLHSGGDYPYFIYNGFDKNFILHENSLCVKNQNGHIIMDETGRHPLLECMCGNIIRGRTNSSYPFFTENGSFWSNWTSELLRSTSEEDRQAHTRNYCNACGFESVALIPIRYNNINIGLLQLNDHRKDRFTIELIQFLEIICEILGDYIHNSSQNLFFNIPELNDGNYYYSICSKCKRIRNNHKLWISIEKFVEEKKDLTNHRFNYVYCSECVKQELMQK